MARLIRAIGRSLIIFGCDPEGHINKKKGPQEAYPGAVVVAAILDNSAVSNSGAYRIPVTLA